MATLTRSLHGQWEWGAPPLTQGDALGVPIDELLAYLQCGALP